MSRKFKNPPKPGDWIIKLFCREEYVDDILGDLYEYYNEPGIRNSKLKNFYYFIHLFSNLRPSLVRKFSNGQKLNFIAMFKLNLKLSIRSIMRHKLVNSISLLGLVLGTISFCFIFRWVYNELSMDNFHENKDRIYITTVKTNPEANLTSISLSTMFQMDFSTFPEVEKSAQFHVYNKGEIKLEAGEREYEGKALIVDSSFLELFNFPMISGSNEKVLYQPQNILLTQSFAELLYGEDDPIGKVVELKCDQVGSYRVAGVIENLPANSSIDFDFLVPRHSQRFWRRIPQEVILVKEGFNSEGFNEKIEMLGQDYPKFPESQLSVSSFSSYYTEHPFPTSLIHKTGSKTNVNNMILVGLLIWLITLFGFSSLQSTLVLSAHKQHGIKKMLGSKFTMIMGELIVGRFILALIALIISGSVFTGVFQAAQSFLGINLDHNLLLDMWIMAISLFLILTISILISWYHLIRMIRSRTLILEGSPFKIPRIQRAVSTIQYSIALIMLITTILVYSQVTYMLESEVGFDHTEVVQVNFFEMLSGNNTDEKRQSDFSYIKNQLTESPLISSFSQGDLPIGSYANSTSWKLVGEGAEYTTQSQMIVDPNYDELLGLQLVKGRFFSDSIDRFREDKVVINEAAMKFWGIEDIEDSKLASNTSGRTERFFTIIGVIRDYHYQDLSQKIKPLVMQFRPYQDDPFLIRFEKGKKEEGLAYIKEVFRDVNPKGVFDYKDLDREIVSQYQEEKALGKIYILLTMVALILSILGMYTFAFYEVKRRTKEIGIRLVNGAKPEDVFKMLSFSILKTLLISFLIAAPVSYFAINNWLQDFASRIDIEWTIFLAAGLFTAILTQLIISEQVYKLSKINPVECLRDE